MKKILISLLIAFTCLVCKAETKTYKISSYCTMNIPTTLELRDTPGVNGAQYCFWPGLASSKYARVLVSIKDGNGLTESEIKNLSKSDLEYLTNQNRAELTKLMKASKQDVSKITYHPMSVQNINGHYALAMRWERPGLDGNVTCEEYLIAYKGVQLDITISYRTSESGYWKTDLSKVMSSIVWK